MVRWNPTHIYIVLLTAVYRRKHSARCVLRIPQDPFFTCFQPIQYCQTTLLNVWKTSSHCIAVWMARYCRWTKKSANSERIIGFQWGVLCECGNRICMEITNDYFEKKKEERRKISHPPVPRLWKSLLFLTSSEGALHKSLFRAACTAKKFILKAQRPQGPVHTRTVSCL